MIAASSAAAGAPGAIGSGTDKVMITMFIIIITVVVGSSSTASGSGGRGGDVVALQ